MLDTRTLITLCCDDLVTLRGAANYCGVSRQAVYTWSNDDTFPDPVLVTGSAKIWSRLEVYFWAFDKKKTMDMRNSK